MTSLTIDLDKVPDDKKGVLLAILAALMGFDFEEENEKQLDPAAIFGPASQSGTITDGPLSSVVIPVQQQAPLPPPPPPASAPTADLDSTGLPWDGRIHASTKAKKSDGAWRLKRNIDDALVASVTTELRRVLAVPGPQLVPNPPSAAVPVQQQAPPPPPAADPSPDARKQYIDLIGRASAAQGAGRVTLEQINKCLGALGVDTMISLGHRLDLVPAACNLIDGIIAGQNA